MSTGSSRKSQWDRDCAYGALLAHHTPDTLPDHVDNVLIGKPGLLRLELDDRGIAWTFHLAPDGSAWDAGKVACRTRS
jgi:hypothetical protein